MQRIEFDLFANSSSGLLIKGVRELCADIVCSSES